MVREKHQGSRDLPKVHVVERQNGKRGLESSFGSAGYVNKI